MDNLEITGGARIGVANASWPFAKLKITKDKLELNASIFGDLVFQPQDIISIKPYGIIPWIGRGIKINHSISNYNRKVIFWTFKDPQTVIDQIRSTGFLDNMDVEISDSDEVILKQQSGGFPIKKSVAIGFIILWNILFIADFINHSASGKKGVPMGVGSTVAMAMLLLIAVLPLTSKGFRKFLLKEGRSVKEISKFLYLLIFISSLMLLVRLAY